MSVETFKSLFDVLTVVLLGLTFLAGAGVLITGNIINQRQSEHLKVFDSDLTKAKSDLATQQERAAKAEGNIALAEQHAAEATKAAGQANEKAAKAQLELARLTGPPYMVPVIQGSATPDLSKGTKQLVLLTSDTRIILPKLPDGKSLTWTLILAQDERGQHQFAFSPQISGFGNTLFSPGHSKWIVNLLTDSSGTVNVGLGGTFVAAPNP
jgi:hypothetical protein